MLRRLLLVVVFAGGLVFLEAHPSTVRLTLTVPSESRGTELRMPLQGEPSGRARAQVEGQEPPPAPASPKSPGPAFETQAVIQEVQAFYADYRQAWDERNTAAIANHLAGDFLAFQYLPPQGMVQLDKVTSVAGVQRFFDAVGTRETFWSRSVLAVVPRSATEAIVAVRNDFSLREGGGEVELTLEVLRKGSDGRWRLVRKWSEKSPF